MTPGYEVYAIKYAHHARRASENFIGGDPHDGPMPLDYFVWLVRGGGRELVVDTGFSPAMAAKRGREHLRCPTHGLRLLGVDAASVKDVVITHLHYDHVGNFELFPAATLHLIGGHTMGLQVVRVSTRRGWVVLASDASHFYANMEQQRPFPIVWSVTDMVAGYDRLRSLAASPGHIIPGHDPLVLERYPAPMKELQGTVVRLD